MAMTARNSTKVRPFRLCPHMQIGRMRSLIVTGGQLVSLPNVPYRLTDPAPVMPGMQPRRNRGVRCSRFVRPLDRGDDHDCATDGADHG
jgi:hypothetical protein